jgi:hypothetical protein
LSPTHNGLLLVTVGVTGVLFIVTDVIAAVAFGQPFTLIVNE